MRRKDLPIHCTAARQAERSCSGLLFSLPSAPFVFAVFCGSRGGGTTQQLCSAPSQQPDGWRSLGAFLHLVPRLWAAPLRVGERAKGRQGELQGLMDTALSILSWLPCQVEYRSSVDITAECRCFTVYLPRVDYFRVMCVPKQPLLFTRPAALQWRQ